MLFLVLQFFLGFFFQFMWCAHFAPELRLVYIFKIKRNDRRAKSQSGKAAVDAYKMRKQQQHIVHI